MAEILLSLTIIGVVAAITLPSLTGNINERTWNTQRKALYSRISQAVALMPALNGYGIGSTDEETQANAAETFLSAGLSKVLKINNICDSEHLQDCGIASKWLNAKGSKISSIPLTIHQLHYGGFARTSDIYGNPVSFLNVDAAAFVTANGESILTFYNPKCRTDLYNNAIEKRLMTQNAMCVNFVYDLNGKKGPNTVGKDIGFISVLYPTDSIVAAAAVYGDANPAHGEFVVASNACKTTYGDNAKLPNEYEAAVLMYNYYLIGQSSMNQYFYWTSLRYNSNVVWTFIPTEAVRSRYNVFVAAKNVGIYCIRRNEI